jgi:putative membrane protein insertion efficiency factor
MFAVNWNPICLYPRMTDLPVKAVGKLLIVLVRAYQLFISPLFPPSCRYYPSCSAYMITAIKTYGPLHGTIKGIARLLRCHPFHPGGYDPLQ